MNNHSKQQSRDEFPNPSKRFIALALAATVLAGIGLKANQDDTNKTATKHFDRIEQLAITEAVVSLNGAFTVGSGATIRKSPIKPDNEAGVDTAEVIVPKDTVLRIDRPINHADDEGNVWLGFTLNKDKSNNDKAATTESMYWINATQLNDSNIVSEPYVTEYRYNDKTSSTNPASIRVEIGESHQFTSPDLKADSDIATAQIVTNEEFAKQANQEGLNRIG